MERLACPFCGCDMEDDRDGRELACSNRICRYRIIKPILERR
jgi:uncharacterized protein YbaR (Trm112 family)